MADFACSHWLVQSIDLFVDCCVNVNVCGNAVMRVSDGVFAGCLRTRWRLLGAQQDAASRRCHKKKDDKKCRIFGRLEAYSTRPLPPPPFTLRCHEEKCLSPSLLCVDLSSSRWSLSLTSVSGVPLLAAYLPKECSIRKLRSLESDQRRKHSSSSSNNSNLQNSCLTE